MGTLSGLVKKEMELAKTELRKELYSGLLMTGGFGIAMIAGFVTVIMLLVTAIMALSLVLPGWAAGLIVSGLTLSVAAAAAVVAWRNRVTAILPLTREALKDDLERTKRLAV
jgi:cobalamin biosynthesis protein CobD/CbiB